MAMAQRATVRQDKTATMMATGNGENDDGDGVTGDKVDDYGEGAMDDDDDNDRTERRNNQIEATAALGGSNSHRSSTAESNDDEDNEVGVDGSTMYDDAMMVAANDDRGRGGRRLSRRW